MEYLKTASRIAFVLLVGGCYGNQHNERRESLADLASPSSDEKNDTEETDAAIDLRKALADMGTGMPTDLSKSSTTDLSHAADLAPTPPNDLAPPQATLRPMPSITANIRVADFNLLTEAAGTRWCVFGADDDPAPYAVFVAVSHTQGDAYELPAEYQKLPAGIPLTFSYGVGFTPLDAGPATCDRSKAVPFSKLVWGVDNLTPNRYYTVVDTKTSWDDCHSSTDDRCDFFPRPQYEASPMPCAKGKAYLIEDGNYYSGSYHPGFRVINLSENASVLSFTVGGAGSTLYHGMVRAADGILPDLYKSPAQSDKAMNLCPRYLRECSVASGLSAVQNETACAAGTGKWLLTSLVSPRLANLHMETTIYVTGPVQQASFDFSEMIGPTPQLVVAHDVSESLP